MITVGHHWQDRWVERLSREFVYTVDRVDDFSRDTIRYRIYCKFYPQGLLGNYQLFSTIVEITATMATWTTVEEREGKYHIHKRTEELRRSLELVLKWGYSQWYVGGSPLPATAIVPILDNWRIDR